MTAGTDCPNCAAPLVWEPSGTLMYCPACDVPLFPAALEPSDDIADPRRVPTRAERDAEGLALAELREIGLAAVGAALDDERLIPGVRGRLKWYMAEITAAQSRGRLSELAAMLRDENIRRGGWFTRNAPNPAHAINTAAIDAETIDAEEDDCEYDEGTYQDEPAYADAEHAPASRILAAAPDAEAAAELAVRGYRNGNAPPGCCQIIATTGPGGWPIPEPLTCGLAARAVYGPYRVCERHRHALTTPYQRTRP